MQPRLALLASTALSATYPVSLKLIYAADGAPLSPALITSLRFALMAGGAALVLSESSSPVASEPLSEPLSDPAAFWRAATELGFWACAGAQLNTAGLQQIGVVRGTVLLSTINVFTPYASEASIPRLADPRQNSRLAGLLLTRLSLTLDRTLSALFGTSEAQRRVPPRVWAACALALASTVLALLGDASAAEPLAPRLSQGDELMLAAAACYATGQVRLSSLVPSFPARRLAAARLQTQALCSLPFLALASLTASSAAGGAAGAAGAAAASAAASAAAGAAAGAATGAAASVVAAGPMAGAAAGCGAAWCGAVGASAAELLGADGWAASQAARTLGWAVELSPTQAALLCFSATTAVTGTLLQYEGQRTVPAAAAQPIYAAAPLLTAMWSFVVLHEPITQFEALGGLGVFGAAALATSSGGGAATGEAAALLPLSMEATTENAGGNEDGA
jgi:hypothetical protein